MASRLEETDPIPVPGDSDDDVMLSFHSAVDRLHAVGFNSGYKRADILHGNIFTLARHSPDTLDDLLKHILSASVTEQQNWQWMLSTIKTLPDGDDTLGCDTEHARTLYQRLMGVHPLVAPISREHTRYAVAVSAYQTIKKAERLVNKHDNDFTIEMFKAAVIVLGIQSLQNDSDSTDEAVLNTDEYESLHYISSNIDTVERVIKGIVARRTTKVEVLRHLIDAPAGLADGHL